MDQEGKSFSLASFKGSAVVLEFMDTHCVDICPLVSREFVNAFHNLGTSASHVVFLAVNVNPFHLQISDVATYSREHQLDTIPTWHFFTGSAKDLRAVWRRYGVLVEARSPNVDVIHTSIIYFLDSHGRERYVGVPTDYHNAQGTAYLPADQLISWGHGIALVAQHLVG